MRLADICYATRNESRFLQAYARERLRTSHELQRLEFSKDVLVILLAAAMAQVRIRNQEHVMRVNEAMRDRYLSLLNAPTSTLVGDCVVCDDEIQALASFIDKRSSLSQIRTTSVTMIGLVSLCVDLRAREFRGALVQGAKEAKNGIGMWIPVANITLQRIRGETSNEIDFDDINHFSVAIEMFYHALTMRSLELFR